MSSSSISSSEKVWKKTLIASLVTTLIMSALTMFVVATVDPYDVFSFSLSLDRQPIANKRGMSVAGLARKAQFDSAVIGSSTSHLLNPRDLDALLGGHFVSLAIWGGTAWEQWKAAGLFARHHPSTRTIVLGLDAFWCSGEIPPHRPSEQFQEWMYRKTSLVDIRRLFHTSVLWDTLEQIDYILKLKISKTAANGFETFLPPDDRYDLKYVYTQIYGAEQPKPIPLINNTEVAKLMLSHKYPNLIYMKEILGSFSTSTMKILMFSPMHVYLRNSNGVDTVAMYEGCKQAVVGLAQQYPNTLVIDFMIDSPLTRNDNNFWDGPHYNAKTGKKIIELMAAIVDHSGDNQELVRLLYR
jgi:hypothetical protein